MEPIGFFLENLVTIYLLNWNFTFLLYNVSILYVYLSISWLLLWGIYVTIVFEGLPIHLCHHFKLLYISNCPSAIFTLDKNKKYCGCQFIFFLTDYNNNYCFDHILNLFSTITYFIYFLCLLTRYNNRYVTIFWSLVSVLLFLDACII